MPKRHRHARAQTGRLHGTDVTSRDSSGPGQATDTATDTASAKAGATRDAHVDARVGTAQAPELVARGGARDALGRLWGWLTSRDLTFWALFAVAILALVPRLYGLNWDSGNFLHPDEREIVFQAMCLSFPGTPRGAGCAPATGAAGWFFSPNSPLNPHFFAYGSFPLYLLAAVAHGLAWLGRASQGRVAPPGGGVWDDYAHFVYIGRVLSALFDAGSVLLAGLIGRRMVGRWGGLLAAAFVAFIPFEVQVSHFYAVDTVLTFCVMLTLLGCVLLAQGPKGEAGAERWPLSGRPLLRATGAGALVGLGLGLALATKVSALPLLAPVAVALLLRWRRRGHQETLLALCGVVGAAVLAFAFTMPYAILDWPEFQAQVSIQTQLSQGALDYPYVRQFADTTPYLYEIRQLLLYDMGLPLALLCLAGVVWAASRLWRRWESDWAVLVVWLAAYFAVVGDAYMKFTRYMLPTFPPLAICGAGALVALASWGTRRLTVARMAQETQAPPSSSDGARALSLRTLRGLPSWPRRAVDAALASRVARQCTRLWGVRWWRGLCVLLGLAVLGCSILFTAALDNIYSALNTRVQASVWIYDHLPPGSTLTYEVWDDPLPIQAPAARTDAAGDPLTATGHPINAGQYRQVGLNLYDADTMQKAQEVANDLASANAVVISSQRLIDSIPKLPDRYPMTVRYYGLLFSGQLGFHLAAHFETHPNLFGVVFNDTGADESYSVYDHPPVWIFTRDGAGLTTDQLLAKLTDGVSLPAASSRPGPQRSLLLTPQEAAADMQSQPLGVQFPASSLPNQIPLIWWLLFVELLGLIAFPLAFVAFPGLHDRGFGLAKLLGLLLLAWLTWVPSSLHILPFTHWVVVGAFVVLALAGAAVAWRARARLVRFVRARWRLLALCEGAFLACFLAFTWVRALDPDLWHIWRGGEKPMELAYLNGILRSQYMPPADAWFSGGLINYYYYGQYLIAVLIKLTGVAPTTAFNLALPLLFGITFTAAFSVVAGVTGRAWTGLLGGVGLVVVGNLDGLLQLLNQWRTAVAHLPIPAFDYWQSSRVIPCETLAGTPLPNCPQATINEFPYWSFLYGDLHAHLIDLPVTLLLIAACASLLRRARTDNGRWRPAVLTLSVIALGLGAAWCINTWDLPTYALLVVVVLGLRQLGFTRGSTWEAIRARVTWPLVRDFAVAVVLTLGAAYALYAPFHANFQNFTSGIGTNSTPTAPWQFAVLFGLWLFVAITFFFVEMRDRWMLAMAGTGAERGAWLLGLLYGAALLLAFAASLKLFLLLLLGLGILLALDPRHSPAKLLTYLLLLLGLAVALGVELVYLRDFLDGSPFERMNTVFKFYYQVWTCFALGGSLACAYLVRRFLGYRAPDMAPRGVAPDATTEAAGFVAGDWGVAPPVGIPAGIPVDIPGAHALVRDVDDDDDGAADAAEGSMSSATHGVVGSTLAFAANSWGGAPRQGTLARGAAPGWLTRRWHALARTAWLAGLMFLALASLVFVVEGTQVRVADPQVWAEVQPPPGGIQPQGLSLDGMAYMRGWYPGDAAAITWMNEHIAGIPTIVEVGTADYTWEGRVSEYTGLPTVLGWSSHESQQRYGDEVGARAADVQNFYGGSDPSAALAFLREYDVSYIYLGQLERTCYMTANNTCVAMPGPALDKFATLESQGYIKTVYANATTTIFAVVPPPPTAAPPIPATPYYQGGS